MLKLIHIQEEKGKKKIPKYKDPVYMAELRRSFIEDHNRKIRLKELKENEHKI